MLAASQLDKQVSTGELSVENGTIALKIIESLTSIFNSFFRYLLPGAALLTTYGMQHNWDPPSDSHSFLLLVGLAAIAGFTLYAAHRTVITFLESFYFRLKYTAVSNYPLTDEKKTALAGIPGWARFSIHRQKLRDGNRGLSDFLDMRWSLAHSAAILSYVYCYFAVTYASDDCWKWFHCIIALISLVLSYWQISRLYYLEKHIMLHLNDELGLNIAKEKT